MICTTTNCPKPVLWVYHRFARVMIFLRLAREDRMNVYLGHGNIGYQEWTVFLGFIHVLDYDGQ